jgi:hypothetical protein
LTQFGGLVWAKKKKRSALFLMGLTHIQLTLWSSSRFRAYSCRFSDFPFDSVHIKISSVVF